MLRTYGASSQADPVSLNRERTSLQRWKYILERGVVLGITPMAALLLDETRTSRNNIIFSVNTFSLILPSTASIDPLSLQDLPVTNIILIVKFYQCSIFISEYQLPPDCYTYFSIQTQISTEKYKRAAT